MTPILTSPTRRAVALHRTVVRTGTAEQLAAILRAYHASGRLVTHPHDIVRAQDARTGRWRIRFEIVDSAVPAPRPSRLASAWARPWVRRVAVVAAAVATAWLAGWLTWALYGDEIAAALILLGKAALAILAALAVGALLVRLAGGGSCPGAHCPPGRH